MTSIKQQKHWKDIELDPENERCIIDPQNVAKGRKIHDGARSKRIAKQERWLE